jgi:hypothetical protein
MRTIFLLAAAALSACTAERPIDAGPDGEAKLAAALQGYEPSGPPVSCIESRGLQGNHSAGEGAIIFESAGSSLYVNRPRVSCPELKSGRALRTRSTSTRFCSGDIVTVFDPVANFEYGSCSLGDFTPYRRVN